MNARPMPNSFAQLHVVEPSATARRLLWHVLSVGRVMLDETDHHEGFDKPGAHLFWVASGAGEMIHAGACHALVPGKECWLVDLRRPRTYHPRDGEKLVTAGFRFGGINLAAWQEMLGPSPVFAFDTRADLLVVQRAQRELRRLVIRRPAGYEWRAHELVQQVLGRLLAQRDLLAAPVPTPAPVRRVLDAVLAEPTRDWRVRELAAIAGASYSALRALFKATQHESIHEFLQRMRLDQARMLLGDPRLAIKDVAQCLNFSSEFYFSHFFREASGMSPSQFRRQLGE